MATCSMCNQTVSRFSLFQGVCEDCHEMRRKQRVETETLRRQQEREREEQAQIDKVAHDAALENLMSKMILTTEAAHNLDVADRLGIVASEYVVGVNILRDIAAEFRDFFGGRSATMQRALREAREAALEELKRCAAELGADAVVGIDLDYSEISGGGKSMLFLVASGTAVALRSS